MSLTELVPSQIWHATQPLQFGPIALKTRMTVVRKADGQLWVHSPIQPTPDLRKEIDQIGPVQYVVAPNRSHHLFFSAFLDAWPSARGYIAPGLEKKRPELSRFSTIDIGQKEICGEELEAAFIEGLPVINETVWLHRPSRTLIVSDLLFNFGTSSPWLTRLVARGLGVYDHLGMSRTMKMMIRDKAAFRRSIDRVMEWRPRRIILAHEDIVETGASSALSAAFAWLD